MKLIHFVHFLTKIVKNIYILIFTQGFVGKSLNMTFVCFEIGGILFHVYEEIIVNIINLYLCKFINY